MKFEIYDAPKINEDINMILSIIRETIQQFKNRFKNFKNFKCNIKFFKYPDEFNLNYFERMNIDTYLNLGTYGII